MDGQQNRNFIAAAQQLHFAHAAREVGIPRSEMISSIKASEAELGYPLFDYEAESTTLTPDGKALLSKLVTEAAKAKAAAVLPAGGKAKASKGKGRAPAVKGAPRVGKRRQSR
jgi:DNA-binding transcriptional LysR family regulator